MYDLHLGIDYSGANTAVSLLGNIPVYAFVDEREPSQSAPLTPHRRWSGIAVAEHPIVLARDTQTFIAGIDLAFVLHRATSTAVA